MALNLYPVPLQDWPLPTNLVVGKSLDICNTPISQLPSGLVIGTSLDMEHTPINTLPPDLKVGLNVWLHGSSVRYGTIKPKGVNGDLIWI